MLMPDATYAARNQRANFNSARHRFIHKFPGSFAYLKHPDVDSKRLPKGGYLTGKSL